MADNIDYNGPLPPGWELRYDTRTKRNYYIDNYNRTTTWEDPRPRYRALLQQQSRQGSPSHSSIGTGEMIPLQHGSSTVYPSQSSYPPPPQPAFQLPPTPFSHLAPSSSLYQDFGSNRPSPLLNRAVGTVMGAHAFQQRSHNQAETSFAPNVDETVSKINATFPTASETHIRMLLKKYHNREAVVMSALQVEKHPIATPGPYSTPPLARNLQLNGAYTPIQMTPPASIRGTPSLGVRSNNLGTPLRIGVGTPTPGVRGSPPTRGSSPLPRPSSAASSYYGSPRFGDYRQSPRPHSSPKMKLRYLKNTFPKADETLLLDVLASEDNNVMRATEKLKGMGFEKRVTPPPPPRYSTSGKDEDELSRKDEEKEKLDEVKPTPPPRMKSLEEKARMKGRLEGLYSEIPERLIQIAMESADFDEEKARQILMLLVHEEKENQPVTESGTVVGESTGDKTDAATSELNVQPSTSSKKSPKKGEDESEVDGADKLQKAKAPKVSRGTSTVEDKEFRSALARKPDGRNSSLRKGPNDQLLLVDYVTWQGPNPDLRSAKAGTLAKGPNKANLGEKRFIAKGPNRESRKGSTNGLAKGSIYSQLINKTDTRGQ